MENKNLENVPGRDEKPWELEKRMETHFRHAKSRYPAMNIEPMAYERERLTGKGMTAEDRALRKQWLLDQRLAPHEPPNSVVALETMNLPVNPIKRAFRMPMDATFRALAPVLGQANATGLRGIVPNVLKVSAVILGVFYYAKYAEHNWESLRGWHVYSSKPRQLYGREVPVRDHNDFANQGFKERKVLLGGKTSFNSDVVI
ncbi:uncharacterized protein [Mytilus edulis]|uniref:uncharacterized protein n=1 Tax=Mytilus edulis TaxID=6550 RepID=UPI0039F0A7C4